MAGRRTVLHDLGRAKNAVGNPHSQLLLLSRVGVGTAASTARCAHPASRGWKRSRRWRWNGRVTQDYERRVNAAADQFSGWYLRTATVRDKFQNMATCAGVTSFSRCGGDGKEVSPNITGLRINSPQIQCGGSMGRVVSEKPVAGDDSSETFTVTFTFQVTSFKRRVR